MALTGKRLVPYKNFRFRVSWRNLGGAFEEVAGVTRVGALRRTTQVVEHRAGGDPSTVHVSPGQTKYEPVTLERGLTKSLDFDAWARMSWNPSAQNGALVDMENLRRDLRVEMMDEAGVVVAVYELYGCWVSEYQAMPELDASANAVAIETLTVQNEGWVRLEVSA
ncbi:MAG: phage tail protein [Alphaproteobacteria bacterium]|nr:phage tail protein [Alphaproteobacteria bacterium]MCB9794950.1 phage tail protein [Alphaproteobacteria bacterium]